MLTPTLIIIFIILLIILIFCSAFFSLAETGLMAINRYRLKHSANTGSITARQIVKLLEYPHRVLALILMGNTLCNIFASSLATLLAIHWWGDVGVAIVTGVLTFVLLIFAETLPKTFAVLHPKTVSYLVVWPLSLLLYIFYPLVFLMNLLVNGILLIFRVHKQKNIVDHLSADELRTVVYESSGLMPNKHRDMMLSLLDLEKITVEDIMIPRHEIIGIDLDNEWDDIISIISNYPGEYLPAYRKSINQVIGVLKLSSILSLLMHGEMSKTVLESNLTAIYFIPTTTTLLQQLANFQQEKETYALVVDEYGDIQGFITLNDILEEVVGEYVLDQYSLDKDISTQEDGSFLVDGGITLRELNKALHADFSLKGPKTLNGLIVEFLENIPQIKTSLKINEYVIEILQVKNKCVKTAKIFKPTKALTSQL